MAYQLKTNQKSTPFLLASLSPTFGSSPFFDFALENPCLVFSYPSRMFSIALPPVPPYFIIQYVHTLRLSSLSVMTYDVNEIQRTLLFAAQSCRAGPRVTTPLRYHYHNYQAPSESSSRNATTSLAVFSPLSSTTKPSSTLITSSSSSISVAWDSSTPLPLSRPLATLAMTSP